MYHQPSCRSRAMHAPPPSYPMERALAEHLPHLHPPQRRGLALWVLGAVLAQSACQAAVLAALLPWAPYHALRQRLREWLLDGADKAAPCAVQVEAQRCFAPLLRWVLGWWRGRELALAVDATAHREDVVALVVSVLYRGSAIPGAWAVLPGNVPGPWLGPILRLLRLLRPAVPAGRTDGAGAGRPGPVEPEAVAAHPPAGLAPAVAHPAADHDHPRRRRAPRGGGARPPRRGLGRARRLGRARGPTPDGHPDRGLDQGAEGALGGGHRPAAAAGRDQLVRSEGVGRARLPRAQGPGLAVAALATHRAGPGRAALAGAGGGELVGAGARHPGRGRARARPAAGPPARPARRHGARPPAPDRPVPARPPVAAPSAPCPRAALAPPVAGSRAVAATTARPRPHPAPRRDLSCAVLDTYPCQLPEGPIPLVGRAVKDIGLVIEPLVGELGRGLLVGIVKHRLQLGWRLLVSGR